MKTMSVLFCAASAVTLAASVSAETPAVPTAQAIKQTLDASAAAWSAGDLKTFMECYEHSPSTRYVSASGTVVGYEAIETMYVTRFKKPGASFGKLTLELIDVKDLGSQYAFVVGRYHLKPDTGAEVSGLTTLLFHKVGGRWLISSDHSS
ncbi:nuclear transport factor 2 family protein [Luteibacter pinisoli]|uniref:Nuclear transport factor 2 family protein n=2 Tax=Luteibacter pinisoli TaxID=2589080 RepID=A0A4Y5Z2E4_9GAMM|nr:nuclear transport factor 2 family protein [Luteibacter pinisoli]